MKNKILAYLIVIPILLNISVISSASSQPSSLGWNGDPVIPMASFTDSAGWHRNFQAGTGDTCFVTSDTASLTLHWKFSGGRRYKYAQVYRVLNPPISLNGKDLIGMDVKGSSSNHRDVRIKFEDGTHQAGFRWENLAGITRWCERISVLKSQFGGADRLDWDRITVLSLEVCSDADDASASADSGTVSFRNLQAAAIPDWPRSNGFESLTDTAGFGEIRRKAIDAIVRRQTETGLFYTWTEDGSSYLYGHGLVLKALSMEGQWENGQPVDDYSAAAKRLADFLVAHQDTAGFWPRAWHAGTGAIRQNLEQDSTIWFGDFPWPVIGLRNYYIRSKDENAGQAVDKAVSFLADLIDPDGKLHTINPRTREKREVTSCEAYAAVILALMEIGDNETADRMMLYVNDHAWDDRLKYWKEGPYSPRVVLFANTWLSQIARARRDSSRHADQALSLAGRVLFTRGPGEPWGLDGIGPVATWYEGTLSYICAGGPGSRFLFEELRSHIREDGMVPHYNEDLGGMAGIWAVDWASLDGTAWLYFAVSGKSPFDPIQTSIEGSRPEPGKYRLGQNFPNPFNPLTSINYSIPRLSPVTLKIYDTLGREVRTLVDRVQRDGTYTVHWDAARLASGVYIYRLQAGDDFRETRKMILMK